MEMKAKQSEQPADNIHAKKITPEDVDSTSPSNKPEEKKRTSLFKSGRRSKLLHSPQESRKPTFWNKLGKAFQKDGGKGGKKKGVFGVPLESIIERDGAESTDGIGPGTLRVPALVEDAITTMRKMDLSVEGVFRKNGNIKRLNETVAAIDKDGCDAVDLTKENVVQVAALLKRYLRELPDPLLTFINWVASFHQVDEDNGSKMDTHNLATVIAPNILFSNAKNTGMDDSFLAIEAVHTLIECNEQMCEVSRICLT